MGSGGTEVAAAQMQLAERFGIKDYPRPAGGCVLTEQDQAKRIAWYYGRYPTVRLNDIRLLLFGRHFQLPHGGWLVLGRDEKLRIRGLRRFTIRAIFWCICRSDRGRWGFCMVGCTRRILPPQPGLWCVSGKKWPGGNPQWQRCCLLQGEKSGVWRRNLLPINFFRRGLCRLKGFRSGHVCAFC